MKKAIAMLLALALCVSAAACGGGSTPREETAGGTPAGPAGAPDAAGTETAEETRFSSSVEKTDLGGEDIIFLTYTTTPEIHNSAQDVLAEEQTGAVLNDAVYDRNLLLSDKFNINIRTTDAGDWSKFITFVNRTVAAGDAGAFDVALGSSYSIVSCGLSGSVMNMIGLPRVDLSKPWWNETVVKESSILNTCYFLMGDMNLDAWTQSYVTYFNPRLTEDYGAGDLYQIVRDGKWTLSKMDELTRSVYSDLNGNGEYDKDDLYGLSSCSVCIDCFFASGGIKMMKKDADDSIRLEFSGDFHDIYGSISRLLSAPEMLYTDRPQYTSMRDTYDRGAFMEDRAMLFIEALSVGDHTLRDMETYYGILPIPKYSEAQPAYSTFSHTIHNSTVSLPKTSLDRLDTLCMIIEDMAYFSMDTVRPAYYSRMLEGRLARDEGSAEMLEIITKNISYDITYLLYYLDLIQGGGGLRSSVSQGAPSASWVETNLEKYNAKCEDCRPH